MSRAGHQQPVGGQGGSTGGFDLKGGAIFGVGAWVVGAVLTGLLAWVEFRDMAGELGGSGGSDGSGGTGGLGGSGDLGMGMGADSLPSAVDFVGWLFYNAHFVDVGLSFMGQGMYFNFVTASVNLTGSIAQMAGSEQVTQMEQSLGELFSTIPTPVWLLVPVVVLVLAGYAVASRNGSYTTADGAKAGVSVVVGYFALAVGGTFLFSYSLSGGMGMSLSIAPKMMMAAGLMGLAYPAIFGGVGGAIAGSMADGPARGHAQSTQRASQGQQGYQQSGTQQTRQNQQPAQGNRQQ